MLEEPGRREPAPHPLRLVQAFVNTKDTENAVEELSTPAALRDALLRIGVLGGDEPELGEGDLRHAVEVREALRELLLANNGGRVGSDALATLERAARSGHVGIRFSDAGAELVAEARGVDGALGRILSVIPVAVADGTWARLKACPRDVCHWVFYDRSRNHSSTWCSMSVCGNRTKTRRYRARRA
ncbi:MAG TPA: CGNR zinc finger domain-containing protein [Gaiellaceae bacterium]